MMAKTLFMILFVCLFVCFWPGLTTLVVRPTFNCMHLGPALVKI